MDDLSVYSEKKLAGYDTNYRESIIAKPQEVSITITAAHIYGQGYICSQIGTKEEDPEYTRFSCGYDEISKIYINNNNKNSPIYIQCDQNNKGVINRRRIILPSFSNNDEIVSVINSAKAEFDKKLEKQRESEKSRKIHEIEERKVKENEILSFHKAEESDNSAERQKKARIDELIGFDDIVIDNTVKPEPIAAPEIKAEPVVEIKAEPKVAPAPEIKVEPVVEIKAEPKAAPAPEIKAAPVAEIKAESKAAPAPEIKAAPVAEIKAEPKAAPAPEIKAAPVAEIKAEPKAAPAPEIKVAQASKVKAAVAPEVMVQKKEAAVHNVSDDGSMSLEEFETSVKKLKAMLDNGIVTKEEFIEEKKKLMKFLY